MRRRKGQAAMEFLMSYGWAILIALVAVGVISYFKILNPDEIVRDQCLLAQGIYCKSHKATPTGASIMLTNFMGRDITVTDVMLSDINCSSSGLSVYLPNDRDAVFNLSCNLTPKSKANSELIIYYDEVGGLSDMSNHGRFVAPVAPS